MKFKRLRISFYEQFHEKETYYTKNFWNIYKRVKLIQKRNKIVYVFVHVCIYYDNSFSLIPYAIHWSPFEMLYSPCLQIMWSGACADRLLLLLRDLQIYNNIVLNHLCLHVIHIFLRNLSYFQKKILEIFWINIEDCIHYLKLQ